MICEHQARGADCHTGSAGSAGTLTAAGDYLCSRLLEPSALVLWLTKRPALSILYGRAQSRAFHGLTVEAGLEPTHPGARGSLPTQLDVVVPPPTNRLRRKGTSLITLAVSAAVVSTAVLDGRVNRLVWSDLVVSAVLILGVFVRARRGRVQLESWLMLLCGVWLVVSPSVLGDEVSDRLTWASIVGGFILAGLEIVRRTRKSSRRLRR